MKNTRRLIISALTLLLIAAMMLTTFASCSAIIMQVKADNLMKGISAKAVSGKVVDDKFINNTADFSIELFKKSIEEDKNSLISPLSVMLALSMTANGADNETLTQMQAVLGGDITIDELNEYLYTYVKNLSNEEKSKFKIANSIWFRDDEGRLTVEKDFLQKNADYYNAAAYKSAFDNQTLSDINNWVNKNTDGMIDKILDEIRDDAVMYLINAIVFDAEWKEIYNKDNISEGIFNSYDGSKRNVEFMVSEESKYLEDSKATGFIKPYVNDKYSFIAILPNEDVNINEYINSMSGENFLNLLKSSENIAVNATMPKFSYDYKVTMNDILKEMGMPIAFDAGSADFNKLGKSSRGNIFIGDVLHKTFISVDERGTKAGAVTKVEMRDESYVETKNVKLDRPFVYAIIDNSTNLPIFIGMVMDIQG
ncbi:MAG: serine protease [Clostridiales bacterium GWF2_36_10]|nr:MAG: serine protease [Clostridiales bacterium GWF2_36_10]HAN21538.1 serine protease [Clostridiales bacterium]